MDLTRYLLFTGLVKHGEMLRYLLAAQVRKRLMQQYQLRRQVKSSALTGNPDKVYELYYIENPDELNGTLEMLRRDPKFEASHHVTEEARLTTEDRIHPLEIPAPLQKLSQMPYTLRTKSQQECGQAFAEAPYLLHVTCTLHESERLTQFNESMETVLKEFERAGLSLIVAGRHLGNIELPPGNGNGERNIHHINHEEDEEPIRILNIWEFENPDSPRRLMARLAENRTYARLDKICDQEQHICRNISRHYQRYPLLGGKPMNIT
jgi:hypothetical protein